MTVVEKQTAQPASQAELEKAVQSLALAHLKNERLGKMFEMVFSSLSLIQNLRLSKEDVRALVQKVISSFSRDDEKASVEKFLNTALFPPESLGEVQTDDLSACPSVQFAAGYLVLNAPRFRVPAQETLGCQQFIIHAAKDPLPLLGERGENIVVKDLKGSLVAVVQTTTVEDCSCFTVLELSVSFRKACVAFARERAPQIFQ